MFLCTISVILKRRKCILFRKLFNKLSSNLCLWFTSPPPHHVRAKNVPTDWPYKSSVSKNIGKLLCPHSLAANSPTSNYCGGKLTSHPCDHWAKMSREMTDFSIIFTFSSLWVKWERHCSCWCSGDMKKDNTKQRHSGASDILTRTDTHTCSDTHTDVCAGCVPACVSSPDSSIQRW